MSAHTCRATGHVDHRYVGKVNRTNRAAPARKVSVEYDAALFDAITKLAAHHKTSFAAVVRSLTRMGLKQADPV